MARQQPIELFMPPNMLKAKVGSGGLDGAAIKRAEAAMENLKGDFAQWAQSDVQALAAAQTWFASDASPAARDTLLRCAHDIKGQAATFDYPLMGRIAASLSHLLGDGAGRALPAGLVQAHVAAIQAVLRGRITDPKNAMALTLCTELEQRVATSLKAG